MEREGEEDLDKDGWTHSRGTRAEPPSGEELPRLSPGVGCDSTAQGNKVTHRAWKYWHEVLNGRNYSK